MTAAKNLTTRPQQNPRSLNNEIVSRQMINEINTEWEKSDRLTVAKLNTVKQFNKQDLIKMYQHSTHFCDIYQYITDGKLPSSVKAQNCIRAKALNYVVINSFLFRIDA